MTEYMPTPRRAANAIAAAQKFWRLWDGRYKRALMDADPKGALPGIDQRRAACELTIAHWRWVAEELRQQRFSPTLYRAKLEVLRADKTRHELNALKFKLQMKAESHRARWHGIADQE
jgi:hypothetical protein